MPVISDVDEDNFDKAFGFFKPVIQGVVDIKEGVPKDIIAKTVEFCAEAFNTERAAAHLPAISTLDGKVEFSNDISIEEKAMLEGIMLRRQMRPQDTMGLGAFTSDMIGGLRMEMQKGAMGLRPQNAEVEVEAGTIVNRETHGSSVTPTQSVEVHA